MGDRGIILQIAKPAVDALVHEWWLRLPQQVRQRSGSVAGATYVFRWVRPALSFPPDAPGMARLGVTLEGGVQLANGRILTLDAFVTATTSPRPTRGETGWYARLALDHVETGEPRLTYAGQPINLNPDFPGKSELAALRYAIQQEIATFFDDIPDLPLSYALPAIDDVRSVSVRVWANERNEMLAIGPGVAQSPVTLTRRQSAALLIDGASLASAFDATSAAHLPEIGGARLTQLSLRFTGGQMRFLARGENEAGLIIDAQPTLLDGTLRIAITQATPTTPGTKGVDRFTSAVTTEAFANEVTTIFAKALAQVVGSVVDDLWLLGDTRGGRGALLRFVPQGTEVRDNVVIVSGDLPHESFDYEQAEDSASFDLRVSSGPERATDGGMTFIVRAVNQHGATSPLDYIWAASAGEPLMAHGPAAEVIIPESISTDANPRQTRALPTGVVRVEATMIDAWGRVTRADIEVDTRPGAEIAPPVTAAQRRPAPEDWYASAPLAATGHPSAYTATGYPSAYTATTTRRTASVPAQKAPQRLYGVFAGALAAFALVAVIVAALLTRASEASGRTDGLTATATGISQTPNVAITPTVTVTATATTVPTAGPTSTPQPFGRFSTSASTLNFTCGSSGTTTLPISLSNSGDAAMDWTATVFGMLTSNQPWADVEPATGTIAPGAVTSIMVTPTDGFCDSADTLNPRIQFTAPGVVPLTVMATHD